jgi:hypothetical protein
MDYPPPSSTEVKERIELYLYSPSVPHGMSQNGLYFKGQKTPRQEKQNHSLTRHVVYKLIYQNVLCIKNSKYEFYVNNCRIIQIMKTL